MREALLSLLDDAKLNSEDRSLWDEVLVLLDDEQAQVFIDYIEDDPRRLAFLTNNLKMKKDAIANDDSEMLDQILNMEMEDLQSHEF